MEDTSVTKQERKIIYQQFQTGDTSMNPELEKVEMLKIWVDNFFGSNYEQMSEETSRLFMNLLLSEMRGDGPPLDPSVTELKTYQIITKRSAFLELQLSTEAQLFLCLMCDNPGDITMYLSAIKFKQVEEQLELVTLSRMAAWFPWGFKTKEAMSEMWDAQKVGGRNLLDVVVISDY